MNRILYIAFFLLISFGFRAQSVEFEKDNFPGKKDELRAARKQLEIGMEFYVSGRREFDDYKRFYFSEHKYLPVSAYDYQKIGITFFRQALTPLTEANKFNPKNARLNYMLGFIWFISDNESSESLKFFESAYALDPNIEHDVTYWLAWSYHLHDKWDEAIKFYKLYLAVLASKKGQPGEAEDVAKKIAECNVGKELSSKPERVFVDNLGNSALTTSLKS